MEKEINKIDVIKTAACSILQNNIEDAKIIIEENYPFDILPITKRSYSDKDKMKIFIRDGFIDRYSGKKLVNPGLLKVLSLYMPETFPYHPHWKMDKCHIAYWELIPTVDHVYPIALGGEDFIDNCVTTSMLHNSIKSNWTLNQLNWELHDAGNYNEYDGLTSLFIQLVNSNIELLNDPYVKRWYRLSESE